MAKLISVSTKEEDIRFGQEVANLSGMVFSPAQKINELKYILQDSPGSIVFWDVDYPPEEKELSIRNVSAVLKGYSLPEKIFAISDQSLNTMGYLFTDSIFNHHIRRRFEAPAPEIIAQLVAACNFGMPLEIDKVIKNPKKIQKISLTHSNQRAAAIEAISNVLKKLEFPTRGESMVSQTLDELLMNAIFDAPKEGSNFYRKKLLRTDSFEFGVTEKVDVQIAYCDLYLCICVRDGFGSVTKDALLKYIKKDYAKNDYKIQPEVPSAGLGIYGILKEGLSLLYMVEPDFQTYAYLFVPLVKNVRSLRKAFHFWSIM